MILLGYSGYKLVRSEQEKIEIFQQLWKKEENLFETYFFKTPHAKEEFEAWLQKNHKVGCALCCFYFTFISRNTIKTAQDPAQVSYGKFGA